MLKINNRKLEDQIKEILQCTSYASVEGFRARGRGIDNGYQLRATCAARIWFRGNPKCQRRCLL